MSKRPGRAPNLAPAVFIDIDMSQPDPDEDLVTKPIRLEDLEARRRRLVTAGLTTLALIVGILIGRFLLP